jgi:hypothetical protein
VYSQAVVTFLDVLGFRDIVNTRASEYVAHLLDLVSKFASPPEPGNPYAPTILAFSDSVVRVLPIDSEANTTLPTGLLVSEIIDLLHAQAELVNERILIRGAVTVGNVFASPTRVFGPALIEAYELESRTAIHPRVVVSPAAIHAHRTVPALVGAQHDLEYEISEIESLTRIDECDGVRFIDYVRGIAEEVDDASLYAEFLGKHRSILQHAARAGHPASVQEKYAWLASYHNDAVAELNQGFLDSLEVDRATLRLEEGFLKQLRGTS